MRLYAIDEHGFPEQTIRTKLTFLLQCLIELVSLPCVAPAGGCEGYVPYRLFTMVLAEHLVIAKSGLIHPAVTKDMHIYDIK